jgi:uncharacterized hydrophobic protein (TIGR00271 family)
MPPEASSEPTFTLLYDSAEQTSVEQDLLPRLAEVRPVELLAVTPGHWPTLPPGSRVMTWLDDAALALLLPVAAAQEWIVAPLPHPGLEHGRIGFGIDESLPRALADILERPEGLPVDILYCNDQPVLNSVVVADGGSFLARHSSGWGERLRTAVKRVRTVRELRLRPFRLVTHKERSIDTAALGVVVVQHGRSSVLSRRLIDESSIADGMLHALVIAPRSLGAYLRYLAGALLLGRRINGRLPTYVGHIRTERLTIDAPKPLEYSRDGVTVCAREIEFRLARQAVRAIPGRHLEREERAPETKEEFKVADLPTGEARTELSGWPLPLIAHAGTGEFRELFTLLRENARASEAYLALMVLSTLLACFGLFADSAPVIIGAMVLAPLMAPIISFAMGILRQETTLMRTSAVTLAKGVAVGLACATLLTLVTPLQVINEEIAARLSPTLLDLGIAVVSGIAGAYAHARTQVAQSLAGVAIAVALVPPLSVAGIGIGWGDWRVFEGAFILFLTNLAGIALAAALTFLLLGYSPFRRARRGLLTSLVLVLFISVPLAVGFKRMVDEHRMVSAVDGLEVENVAVKVVAVAAGDPARLSVRLLSSEPLDTALVDRVKTAIEARLGQPVQLEAAVALLR